MKQNGNNGLGHTPPSTENEIKKYLRILKKRKWVIAITAAITFVFWLVLVVMFLGSPTYTSTALLTFQDPRSMSALGTTERRPVNAGKASLIKTNRLLGKVVEDLQLNLSILTDNLYRSELFDTVFVNKSSLPGEYTIRKVGENKYQLFYRNERRGIKKDSLLVTFSAGDTVRINNFAFVLNPRVFKQKDLEEAEFAIREWERAIEWLRTTVSYKLDRYQTTLMIQASHKNPQMAAKIVNKIAELFVDLNLQIKRHKSNEVLRILENELALAKEELDAANNRLKAFREKYPWVVLTADAGTRVTTLATYEEAVVTLKQKIADLQRMENKLKTAGSLDDQIGLARELLTYLASEGVPTAPALQREFDELYLKRSSLLNEYAPSHPFVKENNQQFQELFTKIISAAQEHVQKLKAQQLQYQQKLAQEQSKLRRMPAKELELAQLLRDREVKDDIYKRVLARYNAAKIENEVEVSDIFIVDYGTPPPPQGMLSVLVKRGLLGIIIAFGLGVGMAIVVEFFDKTVQDVDELQERVKLPILGSIPVIKDDKDVPDDIEEVKGKRDPKLITLDYSPTLESEAYRDLRTKILYKTQKEELSSFLISSLRPNEGKSLTVSNLAITFAQQKISTLLIDADLRRGVLHNVFGNKKKPGLSDFLISNASVDYENLSKLIQNTFIPNLYIITAGTPIPNPTEMLGSERMVNLLEIVKRKFGMVILDTAPFQASSDAAILSNFVDGVVIVIRAGTTNVDHLLQKINEYPNLSKKVLGVVLNAVKVNDKKQQYQYSYYNY